jgi:hypothetical protein
VLAFVHIVTDNLMHPLGMVLPLAEIQQAHALIEGRHTRGKVAVQVVQ